jgi:hypothetical protein
MKSALLTVLIVMAGVALSVSLHTAGFRPGKVFHPSSHARAALSPAHHHSAMLDLEKDAVKPAPAALEEEAGEKHVQELVQTASSHLTELEAKFKAVKDDMAAIKSAEDALMHSHARPHSEQPKEQPKEQSKEQPKAHKTAQKAAPAKAATKTAKTAPASKEAAPADDFAAADADASFIQFDDNMNNGPEDADDSPVPRAARRMNLNFLLSKPSPTPDVAHVFGVAGDGSQRTFDIQPDGTPVMYTHDAEPSLDPTMEGKKENSTAEPDMEKDLVCVCKRHRAPRGEDRVRCKKNATPTPTPTPTPTAIRGVRQCVNGTWSSDSGSDSGVNDVVCIYWPTQMPLLQLNPTPTPTPSGALESSGSTEQDLPPECYDDRNEFVAEGVVEKRKFDVMLLQEGFETCGC